MAPLSSNSWRDARRVRGAPQWQQTQGSRAAQAGSNYYDSGHSRGDSGSRYDSSSTREPEASPRHSEGSSRHDSGRSQENIPQNEGSEHTVNAKYDAHKKHEAREPDRGSVEEQAIPKSLVDKFDKRITSVQQEMSSSLQEATSKENEKFDLIFSILIELQRRQGQLEESLKSIKTQLQRPNAPVPMMMGAPVQPQQQGQMQSGTGTPSGGGSPAASQVSSPIGQQQMCFPAGQMPMGQQCGQMMAPDGSMQMVFVMSSPNGSQMPYVPQPHMMCPAGSLPAMQQQMPVQFVPQGQGNFNEEYQMGGAAAGGSSSPQAEMATTPTVSATVDSPSSGQPQEGAQVTTPDGQSCQAGTQIEEE